jgi:hypothetical protein
MPNWQLPGDYEFINTCHPELIAWHFLRRNPEYQQDYHWFISTWNELEAAYGAPPKRNFESWKKDPRASRSEREIYGQKENASTDDNLLIECWIGTKWGFYKFPVNPNNENPTLGKDLSWRRNPIKVELITTNSLPDLSQLNLENKAAVIFDLQKNLKEQIQSAKQQLIIAQRKNLKANTLRQTWVLCLRILDAINDKETDIDIQNKLQLSEDFYLELKSKSEKLIHDQYLELLNL